MIILNFPINFKGFFIMGIIKTQEAKNALKLGFLCSIAYLACYFARNLLGVLTPSMEKLGVWTTQEIGYISTAYFICYACGQLINGALGDRIRAVYLVSTGLILAGIITCIPFKKFLRTKQNLKEIKAECPEHGKEPNMELFETSENSIEQTSEKTAEVTANDTSKEITE